MKNKINFFEKNGYWVEKKIFTKTEMNEMFYLFYDISYSMFIKYFSRNKIQETKNVTYDSIGVRSLDKMLMAIFKKDKNLIGEIYDTVSFSSTFLRFYSNKKIERLTRTLLKTHKNSSLYGYTNRVRIDPPKDQRRTYGWHQEVFYNVPKSIYLQTWCPIIRNTTKENGTIQIRVGSHKEKIAKQTWKDIQGKATQILIDQKIVNKYPLKELEMKVGDLMVFDGHLFHRSGFNSTHNDIRFSMVGMWNLINNKNFRAPKPEFTFRGISPKKYFENHFKV